MSTRATAIVFGIVAVGFLSLNIWGYDLWAPDEPRYAQVAREMLDSGNWFTPHVNGEPYMEKPPVFFWLIAAVSVPFGDVSAVTARTPSVIAGALTVMLTYVLALRLFNDRVAWWSAIVLMTTARFWWQARTGQIDMVLTMLMVLALYAFWRNAELPARRWRAVFFAMIAIALLTKGPPGIIFPLLLWIAYHWGRREERKRFPLALGVIAAAIVALLWFVPARFAVANADAGAAIGQDVYRQVIGRALLGVSKAQPPWYYLLELPVDLMPWTLIAPWAILWTWRNRRTDAMRLLIAWTIPALVLFSLIAGKRQVYLLPLFPAFAIALAASIPPLLDDARSRYRMIAAMLWTGGLIAMASIPFIITKRFPEWSTAHLYAFTYIGGLAALATLADGWRNRSRRLPALLALPIAAFMVTTAFAALPVLNGAKSARAFCAPLEKLASEGIDYRLYSFMFSREEYIFYSNHFHEPILVDSLPGDHGVVLEDVEHMLRAIGPGMFDAVGSVPIESASAVKPDEVLALGGALEAFERQLTEERPDHLEPYSVLRNAIRDFANGFLAGGPAYMFVQTKDWPLLLAIAPELRECAVVSEENIGARHVLLVANELGSGLLTKGPNS